MYGKYEIYGKYGIEERAFSPLGRYRTLYEPWGRVSRAKGEDVGGK